MRITGSPSPHTSTGTVSMNISVTMLLFAERCPLLIQCFQVGFLALVVASQRRDALNIRLQAGRRKLSFQRRDTLLCRADLGFNLADLTSGWIAVRRSLPFPGARL